ncbi:FixH family protein [Sediminibacterium soli]|uniref:FixH family protein n=1 Tax=Sediminibacterium soli TaxID=2698829 RepID=UPI00137A6C87|nr:FixH family protein [Sediminibacterium soli]NCI45683.1 hypothetical protein [Sediminibacterium soli]
MNWGYRLTLVFIGFTAMIGTLVYKATHTKYELVSKDYYSEELRYQEKIDGSNNATEAGALLLQQQDNTLTVSVPENLRATADSANAWFYCKTDASKDKKIKLVFAEGNAVVNTSGFAADTYELRLQFTIGSKPYYYTKFLTIP